MADARYVIDLILKAHDDSAAAFASLIGNQKAFEEQTKRTQEQVEKSNKALDDSNRSLSQSYKDLKNSQDASLLRLKGVADAQVELEKASRNYAKTLQDVNASEAERQAALQRQTTAYKGLTAVLKAKSDLDQQEIRGHADNVKGINFEISRLEAQQKQLEALAATEAKVARERDQIRQRQVAAERTAGQEQQKIVQQRQRDQEALTQTLRRQAQELGRQDVGAAKYQELSKNIAQTRQELGRLTGDSRLALQEQKRALDDAGVSINKNSKAWVDQRAAIDRNSEGINRYHASVQRAAEATERLRTSSQGIDRVKFQFEVDKASADAVYAAKVLAGRDVHFDVQADIKASSFTKAEAARKALGKDVKFHVEADTSQLGKALIFMRKFSDNLGGSIAQFDNVMRGAFSLLTAVFLPQLIILAGAAAGAMLSLGSSAAFAAGAIGGSLVAGIGQAIPALGVLITAISRVKNVTDAVKQANLLNQQQSYKGAAQARTSASAENTLTNALEAEKHAQEAIVEAQERVNEARAEAKRSVEDLILAEKRASLSVGEAETALRDAIQSGQAGEIASRRLDLQEAQVRAQRAREDAGVAKKTGDPGGRIEDAKKSLKDAEVAAGRAQRAVENARRSSEGAAAGVTAAAGKLQFLKSQMSAAELELFNALTTLQTKFHDFARNVSAPIIESFTHATKRMTELLSDDRIIAVTKDLSKAIAREFNKTTDSFSSGKALKQQILLTKEATKNMDLFGRFTRAAGRILLDIAVAASPAFRRLGRLIADGAENLQKFTGSKQGQKELTDFFNQGIVHLKAWVGLLGSIIHLFAAIAGEGGGAKTGLQLVRSMTKSINEFAESIDKKGSKANKFFRDLFTVTKIVGAQLGPVLRAIAKQLGDIFGDEAGSGGKSVKAFASIMSDILIPALGIFLRNMLLLNRLFAGLPGPVKDILALFIAWSLTFGVIGKLATIMFGVLFKAILYAIKIFQFLRVAMALAWAAGLGPIILIVAGIAALIAIVVLLDRKFHFLKPTFNAVWGVLKAIFNWVKDNWDLLLPLLLGPFGFVFIALRRIHGLKDRIVEIFTGIVDFLKSLPGAFADAGKALGEALWGGIKAIGHGFMQFFVDRINGLFHIINSAIKAYNEIPIAPDLGTIDDIKAPKFAQGGPVGGYGTGDTVAALLEPGEHVWTKDEVARAGGHGIMYALRAFFGGGAQASGSRFAAGGQIRSGDAGGAEQIASLDLTSLLKIIDAAAGKVLELWTSMWKKVNDLTQEGRQDINRIFRQIANIVDERMQDASQSAKRRATQLKRNVLDQFEDMDRGVFRGLRYVARNVNNALDVFGAKPTKISIDTPPGLATGGWIGRPGERGRDMIPTILGRGEAVLNWGHQKIVNSALWNQYGTTLDGMFKRTAGYHAGGAGQGMAGGGFTGPGHSGEGFTPVWNMAKNKFGMTYFTGFDGHNMMTQSGNVSDHFRHMALDMGNGILTRGEDALNSFIKGKLAPTVKQLIWRDKDQFNGAYIGGHQDHVHYAMQPQYAFNASRMAKIISRATRGLSIASLLAGGSESLIAEHLDKIKVKGEGPLAKLTKGALDKLVKFANKYIDKIAMKLQPGLPGDVHYDGPLDHVFTDMNTTISFGQAVSLAKRAGFPDDVAQLFGHIAVPESGLRPGVVNSIGATGLWQIYNHPDLVAKYGDMRNPWNNARAAYDLWRAGGTDPWVSSQSSWGQFAAQGGFAGGLPSFAVGGVVPGQQAGQSTLIEAHAGEWVVNPAQQSKLASLVGATAGKLRDFLGFTGGPTSFQGGGEVTISGFSSPAEQRDARRQGQFIFPPFPLRTFHDIRDAFNNAVQALRNTAKAIKNDIEKQTKRYLATLQQITGENGLLDILSARIERHTKQMATQLLRGQFSLVRRKGKITDVRGTGQSEEEIAADSIKDQIRTLNELNDYRRRVVRVLNSIKRQDARIRAQIQELKKGGITDKEQKEIDSLNEQRQTLRSEKVGLQDRLQEIKDAIAEQIKAIYDARTEQIEKLASDAGRPVELAGLFERLQQAIGGSMVSVVQNRIGAIQQQIAGLQDALAQAKKLGNTELAQQIQDQINDAQVSLVEAQMQLIRTTAEEAIAAADRSTSRAQIGVRIAQALGQSTVAAQEQVISGVQNQLQVLQQQIMAAYAGGNVGLAHELEDTVADTQATLIEAQQELMKTIAQEILDQATRKVSITQIRLRIAQALGLSTIAAQQAIITAIQQQITAVKRAITLATRAGNTAFVQELQDQLLELQASLIDAQQELIRAQIDEIRRASAQQATSAQLQLRIAQAIGASTTAAQLAVIQAIQAQIAALQQAIQLAAAGGNVALTQELQDELADIQASLLEAQQELVRMQIAEIQNAAQRVFNAAQIQQRIAQALGQPTAAIQAQIITAIQGQIAAAIAALQLAAGAGNLALQQEIQDQITDLQVALIEAQQVLVQQQISDIQTAASRILARAQLNLRIAQALGQSTTAFQQEIINAIEGQIVAAQEAFQLALAAGNNALTLQIEDQLAELQAALIDAQQELIRQQIAAIQKPGAAAATVAQLQQRLAAALGQSTISAQQAIIAAIQLQLQAALAALSLAATSGNQTIISEIQGQVSELQVALIEAQQELIRQQISEIQDAAQRVLAGAQLRIRIATALGQSTIALQGALIVALQDQLGAAQDSLTIAMASGNLALQREITASVEDLQATIIEAQQALFQSMVDAVNETSRRAQFQIDLRNRLADLMERGGDAIGASQLREQILAAQRVNVSALLESLQNLLNQQLALPVTEQNQAFIQQLTEQVQDLSLQLEENTLALTDAANATRDAMLAGINGPAQFQTGVFGQLNSLLQSISNITGTNTGAEQTNMLDQIALVLSTQGDQLRQQLLNWLGINLLGLSGTEFVTAIAALDWQTLTLGMSSAEKATFESLINAIIENQLQLQQNTEALDSLGTIFDPQQFTSVAWQWFRTAIFTGSGGLLPQFQAPGLQEGGTVLRTGMALVHEGEWFMHPGTSAVPSGIGENISIEINEAGQPLDVEHLVSRLNWERQGRRR